MPWGYNHAGIIYFSTTALHAIDQPKKCASWLFFSWLPEEEAAAHTHVITHYTKMSQQQHTCQCGAFSPSRGSREKCFPFKFQNNESKTH